MGTVTQVVRVKGGGGSQSREDGAVSEKQKGLTDHGVCV